MRHARLGRADHGVGVGGGASNGERDAEDRGLAQERRHGAPSSIRAATDGSNGLPDAARWPRAASSAAMARNRGTTRSRGVNGILFSEALAAEGAIVVVKACKLGLEGIVSKRAGSF